MISFVAQNAQNILMATLNASIDKYALAFNYVSKGTKMFAAALSHIVSIY